MAEPDTGRRAYRRDVLTAVGGMGVVAIPGRSVRAGEDIDDSTASDDDGMAAVSGRPHSLGTGTVHDVKALIGSPPTNPKRPADFYYQPTGLHVQPGDALRFVFITPDHNVVSYHPAYGMERRIPADVGPISSPLFGFEPDSVPDDQRAPPEVPAAEEGPPGWSEGDGADGDANGVGSDDENRTSIDGSAGESTPATAESGPLPDTWQITLETPGVYDLFCSPHEEYGMAMRVVVGDRTRTAFDTSNPTELPEPRAGPIGLSRVILTDPALQPTAIVEQGTVPWEALDANRPDGSP